jgi:excinuclease ABC subunit C
MVVFEDGLPKRQDYRRFEIRGVPGQDDFASMEEMLRRRLARLERERSEPEPRRRRFSYPPSLIVVDGGRGQLSAAYAAFARLGLENLVAVGLAKREELVYTRDRPDPIALPPGGAALRLLQRLRDEAHRFAVTFHRRARAMRDLRSELDLVPGIGPRRRRALLARFGSVAGVRRATREELVQVVGRRAADAILAHFAANA